VASVTIADPTCPANLARLPSEHRRASPGRIAHGGVGDPWSVLLNRQASEKPVRGDTLRGHAEEGSGSSVRPVRTGSLGRMVEIACL
jgi:hypothetical protein